jgi:hypothetical protein
MAISAADSLLSILQEHFNPREDGWLWIALYEDGHHGGVVQQIDGEYEGAIETGRSLAYIINGCGAPHAFLALCRGDARPTEGDRELWRELRSLLDPRMLTDLVVFNRRKTWSMRAEDAAAVAAQSSSGS